MHSSIRVKRARTSGKRLRLAVMVSAAALLVAACGSSDGSDSNDGAASGLTGDPIKVMTQAPLESQVVTPYPNITETAKTYEKYINDNGGINGRPLEVIVCDNRGDPGEAANCARKAAEEGVVADVGSFAADASRVTPILEEEKIAWFGGCCPTSQVELTSPISFPLGFSSGVSTAAAIKMADDGCERPVQVYLEIPLKDVFETAFDNGWKSLGKDPSDLKAVTIPLAATDYSPQAGEIADADPDCVWGGIMGESNWPLLITALDGVGSSPRYYAQQGGLGEVVGKQFPDQTNGAVFLGTYPDISGSQWDNFRDSLDKYDADSKLDYNSAAGLGTWTAFTAFTNIVKGMTGDITGESFLDAASKTSALDTGGMIPPVDFTKEWTGNGGETPRAFNRSINFGTLKDGEVVHEQNEAIDVTNAYDGNPN